MSAPDGDLETQTQNHRGPLRGMFAVVLFAVVLLGILVFWVFGTGGSPEGAQTQVQEGSGTVETGGDGVSANDNANDDVSAGTSTEADPSAVTVAPETVTAPDSGAGNPADTDPGESQAAEPLDPANPDSAQGQGTQTND